MTYGLAAGFPVLLVLAVLTTGCGASEATVPTRSAAPPDSAEFAEQALRHVVDASVYEVKGEHANAILEWQDALRFSNDDAIHYAMARNYAILKKYDQSIASARKAVELAPARTEYRRMLADIYAGAYRYDEAIQEYREVIRRDSGDADAWHNLARLLTVRDPRAALETYEQILARFGPNWDVLAQAAEMYSRSGRFDKAADMMRMMTELDPSNQTLRLTLAQTLVRAGEYDEAITLYRDLSEMDPGNMDLRVESAGVLLFGKRYDEAERKFAAILASDTVSLDTKIRIGDMYYGTLEKDSTLVPATIDLFVRIQKAHPDDWRSYWYLGLIGAATRNDSLATRNFLGMTKRAPRNPDGWVSLASLYLGKNEFAEIVRILEPVYKQIDNDFRIPFLLGIAYSRVNRSEDAVVVLEKARTLSPRNADIVTQLALVYDGLHRYDDSDSLYEMVLRLEPDNHLALNNYSYSLAERDQQLERALAMSTKAVAAQPDNASYLDTIGWIYYRLGDYSRALEFVSRAVEKGDVSAVVLEHLGDIHFRLDNRAKAIEYWNKALGLDSTNTALKDKVGRGSL